MKMDPEILEIALAVAALTAGLVVTLVILRNKGRRRAEKLGGAFELGTSRPVGILDSALEGVYRGYSGRYQIQYASQYDRGGASLRLSLTSPHQWSAEVARPASQMLAKIGLIKDMDVGDVELDEALRFAASEEGVLRSVFGVETARTAMRALVASENFDSVRTRPDRVDVKWSPRAPQLDEDREALRERLELATALAVACGYPPSLQPNQ